MADIVEMPTYAKMVRQDVIDLFEGFLARAKAGEIECAVVAYITDHGEAGRARSATSSAVRMVGATAMLLQAVIKDADAIPSNWD